MPSELHSELPIELPIDLPIGLPTELPIESGIELPIELPIELHIGPVWDNSSLLARCGFRPSGRQGAYFRLESLGPIHSAWNH